MSYRLATDQPRADPRDGSVGGAPAPEGTDTDSGDGSVRASAPRTCRGMLGPIERVVRRVRRTVSGSDAPHEEAEPSDWTASGPESALDYDPADIERRADTRLELGLAPETFVVRLLRENGGRLKQQDFREYTAWSESTTSRLLKQLEEEGVIDRLQFGREKIIQLAEEPPEGEDS